MGVTAMAISPVPSYHLCGEIIGLLEGLSHEVGTTGVRGLGVRCYGSPIVGVQLRVVHRHLPTETHTQVKTSVLWPLWAAVGPWGKTRHVHSFSPVGRCKPLWAPEGGPDMCKASGRWAAVGRRRRARVSCQVM
jgi:hypothetical protein